MNVTSTETRTYIIDEAKALDQVRFYLDQMGPEKGQLTVTCFGRAWTTYWGAMGSDMVSFLKAVDSEYIASSLLQGEYYPEDEEQRERDNKYLMRIADAIKEAVAGFQR